MLESLTVSKKKESEEHDAHGILDDGDGESEVFFFLVSWTTSTGTGSPRTFFFWFPLHWHFSFVFTFFFHSVHPPNRSPRRFEGVLHAEYFVTSCTEGFQKRGKKRTRWRCFWPRRRRSLFFWDKVLFELFRDGGRVVGAPSERF